MKSITCFIAILTLPLSALATTTEGNIQANKINSITAQSNSLTIDYSYTRTKLSHTEKSTDTGFRSYDGNSNYLMHKIGLGYQRDSL